MCVLYWTCTVWHGGLSGSAPLILATPDNPLLVASEGATAVVDRLYPVTETLFNPFNLGFLVVIGLVGLVATCLLHPKENIRTLSPEEIEKIIPELPSETQNPKTPAEYIDQFRGWILLAVVLLIYPLGHSIVTDGFGPNWTINAYNISFLVLALLLHGGAVISNGLQKRGRLRLGNYCPIPILCWNIRPPSKNRLRRLVGKLLR